MSGDRIKDCSAIAGILPPLYLMFKLYIYIIYQIIINLRICKAKVHFVCVPHNIKNSFTNTICTYVYFFKQITM